jgi:hypothetical protein
MMQHIFSHLCDDTTQQEEGTFMPQRRLHRCMTDLYDAPMETRAWHGLGARLASILGSQTMGLWVEDQGQRREWMATVLAEARAVYQQYAPARQLYAQTASGRMNTIVCYNGLRHEGKAGKHIFYVRF